MKLIPGFSKCAVACLLSCLLVFAIAAYGQDTPTPQTHGIAVANLDRSVKPGDDFYQYANGEWIKRTEIPADHEGTSPALPVAEETDKRVADLIAEAAKSGAAGGEKSR